MHRIDALAATGFDTAALAEAVAFAEANEMPWSRDLSEQLGRTSITVLIIPFEN